MRSAPILIGGVSVATMMLFGRAVADDDQPLIAFELERGCGEISVGASRSQRMSTRMRRFHGPTSRSPSDDAVDIADVYQTLSSDGQVGRSPSGARSTQDIV